MITLSESHKDHLNWLNSIAFYNDQIDIFMHELSVLSQKHPNVYSVIEHVAEYNKILRGKKEKLAYLSGEIVQQEKKWKKGIFENAEMLHTHIEIRREIAKFEEHYAALKIGLRSFASKNLFK